MDLSKAFDFLPHALLLTNLSFWFGQKHTQLIYSYLTNRKQIVKMKGFLGILKLIISGVPQESILGAPSYSIYL